MKSINFLIVLIILTTNIINAQLLTNNAKITCQEYNVSIDTSGMNLINNILVLEENEIYTFSTNQADFFENNTYYTQTDQQLQYFWNFNDGSALNVGNTISHVFTNVGYYNIVLSAIDQNGCLSNNYSSIYVYVKSKLTFDSVSVNPLEICLGNCIELEAYKANNEYEVLINNDFNDGTIGLGWYYVCNPMFDNPCNTIGSYTTFLWMGDDSSIPRDLVTDTLNLHDDSKICFDLKLSTQYYNSTCNGPDQMDEGVSLQYTTDGGSLWYDLAYFAPDMNTYSTNSWIGSNTPVAIYPYNSWRSYCIDIPEYAITNCTQIRWHQEQIESEYEDQWGLDNVKIDCTPRNISINWEEINEGQIYSDTGSFTKCPTQNTTYKATISDGIQVDSIMFDVIVHNPPPNILPTDTFVNPNQNYEFEISDIFDSYLWSNGDTINNILIIYDSLNSGNNIYSVNITDDSLCTFVDTFIINKYLCQEYSVYYDTTGLEMIDGVLNLCKGDVINLNYSYSNFLENDLFYTQTEQQLEFFWNINDGSPIYQGSSLSHTFINSVCNYIEFYAIDQYECKSMVNHDIKVYVPEDINLNQTNIISDTINLGDTLLLNGYKEGLISNFEFISTDSVDLPDGNGVTYNGIIPVNLTGFYNSETKIKVKANLYHTYAADLLIYLESPSGQTVTLHYDHGNISGTDLGGGSSNCAEYEWSQTATNGTWNDQGNVGSLASGTYEPEEDLSGFIGSVLIGDWTLHIQDTWALYTGFLCSWSIQFDLVQNQIGDYNSLWQGENINNPANDTTYAVPTTIGLHPYTYTVENEYGCTTDTTIYVYVDQATSIINLTNNTINIYPNPATNQLTIESITNIETIEILDITGKTILTPSLQGSITKQSVNISTLEKGIYFIKINDNNLLKFMKE